MKTYWPWKSVCKLAQKFEENFSFKNVIFNILFYFIFNINLTLFDKLQVVQSKFNKNHVENIEPLVFKHFNIYILYILLAERTGVARGKKRKKMLKIFLLFLAYNTPGHLLVSTQKFRSIGPAVWPAICNIYMNVLFYFVDLSIYL